MFIFYIKIIDLVLLGAKFRGIGAYSRKCLFIVQFGAFWSTFSEIFLLRKYEYLSNIDMDACMGGGARIGAPPPMQKHILFCYLAAFLLVLLCWDHFATFLAV